MLRAPEACEVRLRLDLRCGLAWLSMATPRRGPVAASARKAGGRGTRVVATPGALAIHVLKSGRPHLRSSSSKRRSNQAQWTFSPGEWRHAVPRAHRRVCHILTWAAAGAA